MIALPVDLWQAQKLDPISITILFKITTAVAAFSLVSTIFTWIEAVLPYQHTIYKKGWLWFRAFVGACLLGVAGVSQQDLPSFPNLTLPRSLPPAPPSRAVLPPSGRTGR